MIAIVIALVAAACGGGSSQEVTIRHEAGVLGGAGTFTVTGGAVDDDIVCTAGEVEAVNVNVDAEQASFEDRLTCDDGTGSFVLTVEQPRDGWEFPEPYSGGKWTIAGGTGDYQDLRGSGSYAAVYEPSWVQTYDGTLKR